MLKKTILREIKKSLGRYLAILAIVALGVGFFSGLKVCKEAMLATGDKFLKGVNFFDFEGISTLGFDKDSVESIKKNSMVTSAEGTVTVDVLFNLEKNNDLVFSTMSLPKEINLPELTSGRMPTAPNECLIDDMWLGVSDVIGEKLVVSQHNSEDTLDILTKKEYTIVGAASSPLQMNYERGTTSVGSGIVSGFVYLGDGGFDTDFYTGLFITVGDYYPIYSDDYKAKIDAFEAEAKELFTKEAETRYNKLLDKYEEEYNKEIEEKREEVIQEALDQAGDLSAYGPMADTVRENIIKEAGETFDKEVGEMPDPPFDEPRVYALDRDTNVGYVCYDSDTTIIDSIARVFPIFFFIVAALVCMTSMARMVDEKRTQMGVLKALGFSNASIMNTYLFYSASASLIGGFIGFMVGAYLFPYVIWKAYTMMYDFSDMVVFVINWKLGIITILVALAATLGATLVSCLADTREVPAELIRPKAPNPGKRILLEKIPFIWNKVSFLYKVSLRNIFRYKKRFLMMIMGISGCTALLVTGFGIKDSISQIANYQYNEIHLYDYSVSFDGELPDDQIDSFTKEVKKDGNATDVLFCEQLAMNYHMIAGNPIRLIITDFEDFDKFIDLHYRGEAVPKPGKGEIIICESYANRHNLSIGSTLTLEDDDMNTATFTVSGICENYIYNYGYVTPETFEDAIGRAPKRNTAFVITDVEKDIETTEDELNLAAAKVRDIDKVASVSLADEFKKRISTMMESLNAIVYLIIACAGALAFIVIYNLTNINITERIREIATIKVLGFQSREVTSYVYRENLFLTGISAVIGIFLGRLLLSYIMSEIKVDMIFFPTRITSMGIIMSLILTFVFASIVMFALYFKLQKISMTESLKTVE